MRKKQPLVVWNRRRGASATEFAVILPFLMLILLGCIDFGRFGYNYVGYTNGARVGAGWAAEHPYGDETQDTWKTQLRSVVVDEVDELNAFDDSQLQVDVTRNFVGPTPYYTVIVSHPFETIIPWPGIPDTMQLSRKMVMRSIR